MQQPLPPDFSPFEPQESAPEAPASRRKSGLWALLRDARASGADAVLYGHTHVADCHQEEDGLWVLNPGSCGYFGGSAGIIETAGGGIAACRILREADLPRTASQETPSH